MVDDGMMCVKFGPIPHISWDDKVGEGLSDPKWSKWAHKTWTTWTHKIVIHILLIKK